MSIHERIYLVSAPQSSRSSAINADLVACEAARVSGSANAWRAYLREFPSGQCASAARVAIADPVPPPSPRTSVETGPTGDTALVVLDDLPYDYGSGLVVDRFSNQVALVAKKSITVVDSRSKAVTNKLTTSSDSETFRFAALSNGKLFATVNRGIDNTQAAATSFLAGLTLGLSTTVTGGLSNGRIDRLDLATAKRVSLSTSIDAYEIDVQPSGAIGATSTGSSDLGIRPRVSLFGPEGWSLDSTYMSCDALRWLTDAVLLSACDRENSATGKSLVAFSVTQSASETDARPALAFRIAANQSGDLGFMGDRVGHLAVNGERSVIAVASDRYPAVEIWLLESSGQLRRAARLEARQLLAEAVDAELKADDSHGVSCLAWTSDGRRLFVSARVRTATGVGSVVGLWDSSTGITSPLSTRGHPTNCASGPNGEIIYTAGKTVRRLVF